MKNLTKSVLAFACASALILTSCSKPKDGATGPQGPAGNANVTNDVITVTPGSWSAITGGFSYTASIASITDYNKDLVNVYLGVTNGYAAMPLNGYLITGDQLTYLFGNSKVVILYVTTGAAPTSTVSFKISVAPQAMKAHNPNGNNFNNMKAASVLPTQTLQNLMLN